MSDAFDIGPLTWVKDEIDKSLNTVLENLQQFSSAVAETAPLRFAQTHAYQASGALDMVGLEGCKFFCTELEKTFAKLEKNELPASPELIAQCVHAVHALKNYLDGLMQGAADIPLRLYDALLPIMVAQGSALDKSELFFPDTNVALPKDLPAIELSDIDYTKRLVEQRALYQKSFLGWLKTKQSGALQNMTLALEKVTEAMTRSAPKAMWWVASAFTESLANTEIAELPGAKRLCRIIDQELKLLQGGAAKVNPHMLKDMLYYVAIAESQGKHMHKVKHSYDLPRYIEQTGEQFSSGILDYTEIDVANQLAEVIAEVGEIWNELSNKIDFGVSDPDVPLTIAVDSVLVTRCADILAEQEPNTAKLSQVVVFDLYHALSQALHFLRDGAGVTSHPILIEIAAGIHLLQAAFKEYSALDADKIQKLLSQIKRLELIASGAEYNQLAQERSSELDSDTTKTLVAHIQASLRIIEQALDAFFRKPTDKSSLLLTAKPLREAGAIFDMLNRDVPTQIIKFSQRFIEEFQSAQFSDNHGEFELLAESLSMLGLYAESMPKVRPEYEAAMQSALQRMQATLANNETPSDQPPAALVIDNSTAAPALADQPQQVTDKALDAELLEIYLAEAEEVLASIAENLQVLKLSPSHESLIEVRRSFHTLKGSGRTVGLTALGEIAGKVETFLNQAIDQQQPLNAHKINEIEQVSVAFSEWAETLRTHQQLTFDQTQWLARIANWQTLGEEQAKPAASNDVVMIGGKRALSRQLYSIFLNESMLHITTLEQDLAAMNQLPGELAPSQKARHALHTLASNALVSGFISMGELGRTAELWLDEVTAWAPSHHTLYNKVVKSIAQMWQAISEQKEPKAQKALLRAVAKAVATLRDEAASIDSVMSEPASNASTSAEIAEAVFLAPAPVANMASMAEPEHEADATPALEVETELAAALQATQAEAYNDERHEVVAASSDEQATTDLDDILVDNAILELFHEEAEELLPLIGSELRAWQADPQSVEHPDALQRALHTLKGSARMAGRHSLGNVVHDMEERIVQAIKAKPNAKTFDYLFADLDAIGGYFDEEQLLQNQAPPALPVEVAKSVAAEHDLLEPAEPDAFIKPVEAHPNVRAINRKSQFVRMRADTLDRFINEAGEISIIRSRIDKEVNEFKTTSHDLTDSVTRLRSYLRELEIEADTQLQSRLTLLQEANDKFDPLEFDRFTRLQELTRMMAESVNDINTIQQGLIVNLGQAEAALQQQTRMNRDLQQGLMGVRMLPFSQVSERMERIVRQTARELNKIVTFSIEGDHTEIDRSVLDKIGAPLEHLLRNAVAHGLESIEERRAVGKTEAGQLRLKVRAENDEIKIVIEDDGAGIPLKKVKEVAVKQQLIGADEDISDQSLMAIIFEPGFSTSSEVTQIAGRGVGLDVVRSEVTGLGGRIDVDSQLGEGTRFSIYLPVTLTVAQVLMVRCGHSQYAISVSMIEQAQKVKPEVLAQAYADGAITWAGHQYPIHTMAKLLNQATQPHGQPYASVLLLRSGTYRIAMQVDDMLGNQEVVVKPIGVELARVPGIMGATVTGNGSVIFILNPLLLANREAFAAGAVKISVQEPAKVERLKALVVDDSLTMRKVLGRLMEREGYEVLIAKDGMDAMQILQHTVPDVILTDIEMPRMDGFGLARNIRNDVRTALTPLIMISSRTADKHQNLAKDIGVDAFFGKPVQDEELAAKVSELMITKKAVH